jgi:hypothetical protein
MVQEEREKNVKKETAAIQTSTTSAPFFCFSSTISFSVFRSLFIVFQLALL